MRKVRTHVLVVGISAALATGGLGALASGAAASAPAVSKTCKTYNKLNRELDKIDPSETEGFDPAEMRAVAKAFRNAARKAPAKLKSAMTAIAEVYDSLGKAKNEVGAVAAYGKNAQKFSKAITTWSTYFTTNCLPTS